MPIRRSQTWFKGLLWASVAIAHCIPHSFSAKPAAWNIDPSVCVVTRPPNAKCWVGLVEKCHGNVRISLQAAPQIKRTGLAEMTVHPVSKTCFKAFVSAQQGILSLELVQ
jgi:hypothetical protein